MKMKIEKYMDRDVKDCINEPFLPLSFVFITFRVFIAAAFK